MKSNGVILGISSSFLICLTACGDGIDREALKPLISVCSGEGITQAAAYNPATEIKPMVGIEQKDETKIDLSYIDVKWRAKTIADTQLVACIKHQPKKLIETCKYASQNNSNLTYSVERYRNQADVVLLEAKTAKIIAKDTLAGEPLTCNDSLKLKRNSSGNKSEYTGDTNLQVNISNWTKEKSVGKK